MWMPPPMVWGGHVVDPGHDGVQNFVFLTQVKGKKEGRESFGSAERDFVRSLRQLISKSYNYLLDSK